MRAGARLSGIAVVTTLHTPGQKSRVNYMAIAACIAAVLTTWQISAAAQPKYSVTDLGVTGGFMAGMNDYGQIVGWTATPTGTQPYIWTPTAPNATTGSLSFPDGLFNGASTDAWGINASGQVAGRSNLRAVLWNPTTPNGGTFGPPIELTQPGGPILQIGTGINASGQVTGRTMQPMAFLFTPTAPDGSSGSVIQLGTLPPSVISFGTGINNYGQVTGTSGEAFVWTPDAPNGTTGKLTGLAPALNSHQVLIAINNSGSIAGPYTQQNGTVTRSFLWTPDTPNGNKGSYVDLGTLAGATRVAAAALNDQEEVVGDYGTGAGVFFGFLWTRSTGIEDVNTLLDPIFGADWKVQHAYAINNFGQIGAYALLDQGGQQSGHFVLLSPSVPEPATLPLAGIAGIAGMAIIHRRRRQRSQTP